MRNLLALVGAAVLTFAGAGWYLGWYKLQPALGATPGHQNVTIDIDGAKVKSDLGKGEQKVEQALERAVESTTARAPQSPAPAKSAAQ
jgi:hypothetical protein